MKKYTFKFKAWSNNYYLGILSYDVYEKNYEAAKEQFDIMYSYSNYAKIELL